MNANKTCFIHVRPKQHGAETVASRGGFTVAWKITDAGDIVIGHPAICIGADHYVKRIGREIAERNLNTKPAIKTITSDQLTNYALMGLPHMLHPKLPFTMNAKNKVVEAIKEMIVGDRMNTMSSNWFELVVQSVFRMEGDSKASSLTFYNEDGSHATTFHIKEPKPVVIGGKGDHSPVSELVKVK